MSIMEGQIDQIIKVNLHSLGFHCSSSDLPQKEN